MHVLAYECMYPQILKCLFLFGFILHVDCRFFCLKVFFGTMYNTVIRGQELGPHATLILYMNIKTCFPYGESFKLYIACTLWAAF